MLLGRGNDADDLDLAAEAPMGYRDEHDFGVRAPALSQHFGLGLGIAVVAGELRPMGASEPIHLVPVVVIVHALETREEGGPIQVAQPFPESADAALGRKRGNAGCGRATSGCSPRRMGDPAGSGFVRVPTCPNCHGDGSLGR